jgi:hypothetical protein
MCCRSRHLCTLGKIYCCNCTKYIVVAKQLSYYPLMDATKFYMTLVIVHLYFQKKILYL